MKTAVSVPNRVFAAADRLARRQKKSRSQLYSDALVEYVARHGTDEVTAAMDAAVAAVGGDEDRVFAQTAAARLLKRSPW